MADNPMSDAEYRRVRRFTKLYGPFNAWVYRVSGGRLLGSFGGSDICVVKMTGVKSGKQRWVPLMYVPWKEGVVLVASMGGAPRHPVWYHNVVAHPEIEVNYRGKVMQLTARRASMDEKQEIWPTCVQHYPPYEQYQARTNRDIPVFICE